MGDCLLLDLVVFDTSLVAQMVKNLLRDLGPIPGSGRFPGEGNGYPLPYSCLGNPMDRGAWRDTVHGVTRVEHDLATKSSPQKRTKPTEMVLFRN